MQSPSIFYDAAVVKEESEPHALDKSQAITNHGRKTSPNDISVCESSFETVLPETNDQNWLSDYLEIKMKTMEEEIEKRVREHLVFEKKGNAGLQDAKEDLSKVTQDVKQDLCAQSEAQLKINQKIANLEKSCVELNRKQRKHQAAFGDVRSNAVLLKDILSGIIRLVDSLGAAAEPHIKNHNRLISRVTNVEQCLLDAGILESDTEDGITISRKSPRGNNSLSAVLPAEDFQMSCIELEDKVKRMSRDGGLWLDSLHTADDCESRASSNFGDCTPRSSSTNPSKAHQEGGSALSSPNRNGRHAYFSTEDLHVEIEIESNKPEEPCIDILAPESGQEPPSPIAVDSVDEERTSQKAQQPQKDPHRVLRIPPYNSKANRPSSPALPGSTRHQTRHIGVTQPGALTAAALPQNAGSAIISNVSSKPQLAKGAVSAPQSPVCDTSRKQTDSMLEEALGIPMGVRHIQAIPTIPNWAQPVMGAARVVEDVARRSICLSASLPTVVGSGVSSQGNLHGSLRAKSGAAKGQELTRVPSSSRSISPNGARIQSSVTVPPQNMSARGPSSRSISPSGVPPQTIPRANALGTGSHSPRSSWPIKFRAALTNAPHSFAAPPSNQLVAVPTPRTISPTPSAVPPANQIVGAPTPRARSPTNVPK